MPTPPPQNLFLHFDNVQFSMNLSPLLLLQLYEGHFYASAHAHDVDGDKAFNDGDQIVDLEPDFEMAPGEPNDVAVCNAHFWACDRLYFADGSSAYTALSIAKKPDNSGNITKGLTCLLLAISV